jgi:2-polyprenyl-3-methyl-5-hydroxy-6-metoxy-1,4-benzoquinol methylase
MERETNPELVGAAPSCRFCDAALRHTFVDLGPSPLCQKHLRADQLARMEPFYPLHVRVCSECFLVQIEDLVTPEELFGDGEYAYFSSYSETWLAHARDYVETVTGRFGLDRRSLVVEVASNDGYLLENFAKRGIPVLGIEPAANTAEVARRKGVETRVDFFGLETAQRVVEERGPADLLLGNNVLAHVPDINDFSSGLAALLAPGGVLTLEFPHLARLVAENQFDTIYHEHFSYLSFTTVERILAAHGLTIFDVEELPTHGGSLRIYGRHQGREGPPVSQRVAGLRGREEAAGMNALPYYTGFGERVQEVKRRLLQFLIQARDEGRRVVGYGAPGKGNTLLNYCGIRTDFLDYTVDRSPHKQGGYLPGSRIPILAPEEIERTRPDYVLILPWNLKEEIMDQMSVIRSWNGRFVVPIPEVRVFS